MPFSASTTYKLMMLLCGIALGLSAPGFNFWKMAWLALIPALYWTGKQTRLSTVYWGGFLLGFMFQGLYCLWFFDLHPLTWLGFDEMGSRLVTLVGWLLIAAEGGILAGLLMVAYQKLPAGWVRILLWPILWILFFALLNCTPLALPWGLLEYTQASVWPMRWLASLIGGWGITLLLLLYNTAWVEYFQFKSMARQNRWMFLWLPLIPIVLGFINRIPEPSTHGVTWPIPVAVTQGSLPIEIIRSAQLNPEMIQSAYINPLKSLQLPPGTLLVYPEEGVAPGWTSIENPYQSPMISQLATLAQRKKIYIAVGVSAINRSNHRYNAIMLIAPDGTAPQFYHKRRLVPFGESTPYGLGQILTELLSSMNIDYSAPYDAGETEQPLQAGKHRLGGLICFELIDSAPLIGGYAQQYKQKGADLLINTSNLGWFHENPFMEAQFLAIGQIRAAEARLPLVISSNTGISAILSERGKILTRTRPTHLFQHKTQVIFYNGKMATRP